MVDCVELERSEKIRAHDARLRKFQVLLNARDPGFGGLMGNTRPKFPWWMSG